MASNEPQKSPLTTLNDAMSGRSFYYTIVGSAFLCLGILLAVGSSDADIMKSVRLYWPKYVGSILGMIGFLVFVKGILTRASERRFVDVDQETERQMRWRESNIDKLISDIQELKESRNDENIAAMSQVLQTKLEEFAGAPRSGPATFEAYFGSIRELLERKADVSDQKASILLDRGITYTKAGIIFFIASIVAWQALSFIDGFKVQFIYGIVSCSLLFVFIEFLSAWFLTQYRHFVDTSTYLIKVKAVFDRYLLTYLAIKEFSADEKSATSLSKELFSVLHEDIRWPEMVRPGKDVDSFARSAMDSFSELARSAKALRTKSEEKDVK